MPVIVNLFWTRGIGIKEPLIGPYTPLHNFCELSDIQFQKLDYILQQ